MKRLVLLLALIMVAAVPTSDESWDVGETRTYVVAETGFTYNLTWDGETAIATTLEGETLAGFSTCSSVHENYHSCTGTGSPPWCHWISHSYHTTTAGPPWEHAGDFYSCWEIW